MKKNILIITIGTRDIQTTEELIQNAIEANVLQVESLWIDKKTNRELISSVKLIDTNQIINLRANTNEKFPNFYIFSYPRQDGYTLTQALTDKINWLIFPLISNPLAWLQKK